MRGVVLALVRRPWPPGWRPRRAWAVLIAGALAVTAAQAQPGWAAYTHSTGEQAEVRDGELRGRPHAGKRAYYLELLRALLSEVDDPELRATTLALCQEVAQADAHLSEAEESLLAQTAHLWGLGLGQRTRPQRQSALSL